MQPDGVPGVTLLDRQVAQRHIAVQRRPGQRRDHLRALHAGCLEHRQHPLDCPPGLRGSATAGWQPGEVVDDVGWAHRGQRRELVGEHVERVDLQRATGRACIGQVGQGSAREIVDDVDRVALGNQPIDQVRTQEPGASDNQYVHVGSMAGRNSSEMDSPGATWPCRPSTLRVTFARSPTLPITTEFATAA